MDEDVQFFDFVREVRTPNSEIFTIFKGDQEKCYGRLDLHYHPNSRDVSGLLCLYNPLEDEELADLLAAIDAQLVNSYLQTHDGVIAGAFNCDIYNVKDVRNYTVTGTGSSLN